MKICAIKPSNLAVKKFWIHKAKTIKLEESLDFDRVFPFTLDHIASSFETVIVEQNTS